MHEHLKIRFELLKEIVSYLNNSKTKYYLEGDILINIFNNIEIKNNILFDIVVLNKIKNINGLNTKNRYIRKISDDHYRYVNTDTLYLNLLNLEDDKSIYIDIYFDKKDYKEYKKVKINNFLYSIPKNLDSYMFDHYGPGFKYLTEKKYSIPANIVYSPIVSYKDYEKVLKDNDIIIDNKIFIKNSKRNQRIKKHEDIISNYKNIVKRTDTRFKMLKIYENKKDEILKLYDKKDYESLGKILNDYLFEIKKFYDLNLAICFDKDIFDITIDYLNHNKENNLADFLIENTPKSHLKNISFTYNGKVKNDDQYIDLMDKHLQMLKTFDKYCKKHNIKYSLEGGAVIGAVRHGGFIPWDDDIDVVMTYDNYNKFSKKIAKYPIENTKFVDIFNTPTYSINFGRLYDLNSFRVYYTDSLLSSSYGYHLDIFVVDQRIRNKRKRNLYLKLFKIYGQCLNKNSNMYEENLLIPTFIVETLMKLFGRKNILNIFHKILFKNNDENCTEYEYRWRKKVAMKKEFFEKQDYLPFCDTILPVPHDYIGFMEKVYGESWYIYPPKSSQKPENKILNIYVPYYMYQNDYLSFIDKNKVNKAYRKVKYFSMKQIKNKDIEKRNRTFYKYYRDKLEIDKTVDINLVKKYFEDNEYLKIKDYLKNYYSSQNKSIYLKNKPLFINDQDFIYMLIYSYIMCGEFYNVRSFSKSSKIKKLLGTEKYNELLSLMDNCKDIKNKTNKQAEDLYIKYPYCIDFSIRHYKQLKDMKEKEKFINKIINIYHDLPEAMYLNGLYLLENKKHKEAMDILEKVKENTLNGLIVLEIDKLLKKNKSN